MVKFVKKYLYWVAYPIARIWWFVIRPETRGVKCLITNANRFLLVKFAYAHKSWSLPGGGVNKSETPEEGVRREVFEELGIKLEEVERFGEYKSRIDFKRDTVTCFLAKVDKTDFEVDGAELEKAGWFDRESIPINHTPSVEYLLKMYDEYNPK